MSAPSSSVRDVGYLGDLARAGRDNNLNLLRAIAALAVLVSHAWPIANGPDAVEPLSASLGISLGRLAVFVFFVISGYLIAASYARARTRAHFILSRILRLMPGLVVSLLLVAFVLGPLVTILPLAAYLTHSDVWAFMVRNLALVQPQYLLPGVFEDNPIKAVEGSIWTLFHEVVCYVGVFILGVSGILSRRSAMAAAFGLYATCWVLYLIYDPTLHPKIVAFWHLSLPFAFGTLAWRWQDRLPLSLWGIGLVVLMAWVSRGTTVYPIFLVLAISYVTFWLAYVPRGFLRAYNRLGDYSYGIYIYAFPLQGFAVWLWGPMTPWENIVAGLLLTLPPSILSWHLVEKPSLGLRDRLLEGVLRKKPAE